MPPQPCAGGQGAGAAQREGVEFYPGAAQPTPDPHKPTRFFSGFLKVAEDTR